MSRSEFDPISDPLVSVDPPRPPRRGSDSDGPFDPRDHDPETILAWGAARGFEPIVIRRWLGAYLQKGVDDPADWTRNHYIPKRLFEAIGSWPPPRLTLERHEVSSFDNFQKLLFRAPDGLPLETVLIPLHKPGAVSLCLSSQTGCPMACVFCATARMPSRRNLAAWEIVDQFLQARRIVRGQGRRVTGAVFMGMGEPFLNYDRVMAAAELMRAPFVGAVEGKRITVSTVGLVPQIDRFTGEGRKFRLSISLGAATDEKRRRLVPVAARTPVAEVVEAARRHQAVRGKRINLAYVCIPGENMDEDDARELARLIGDLPVRFDLIEVNDPSGRFRSPTPAEFDAFRDALDRHLRQPIVRRYSGGSEIRAACGTLAGG